MKKIVFLLILAFALISVSGSNAFARGWTPPPVAVANVACSLSAPTFVVTAYSSSNVPTTVTVATDGSETCAKAIADHINAGLRIQNVQTVASDVILYTLVGAAGD